MSADPIIEKDEIERAMALARVERPAYSGLYDLLEALFNAGAEAGSVLTLEVPAIESGVARMKWENGFPLLNRWDFPVDFVAAESLLKKIESAMHAILAAFLAKAWLFPAPVNCW